MIKCEREGDYLIVHADDSTGDVHEVGVALLAAGRDEWLESFNASPFVEGVLVWRVHAPEGSTDAAALEQLPELNR